MLRRVISGDKSTVHFRQNLRGIAGDHDSQTAGVTELLDLHRQIPPAVQHLLACINN